MRISDWSSDVCSSDLQRIERRQRLHIDLAARAPQSVVTVVDRIGVDPRDAAARLVCNPVLAVPHIDQPLEPPIEPLRHAADDLPGHLRADRELGHVGVRSEEHTSELQSLMHISYAVFCLKKKTTTQQTVKAHDKYTQHI